MGKQILRWLWYQEQAILRSFTDSAQYVSDASRLAVNGAFWLNSRTFR